MVAAGFADMEPAEVEIWLQQDTRNLSLAVQSVIQARAAFDEQKIAALGRAFRAGVTDAAKVDESLLVVLALGTLERPHIDVLHVIALEEPPWRSRYYNPTSEEDPSPAPIPDNPAEVVDSEGDPRYERSWTNDGLTKRLPHLAQAIPWLEQTLRTNGITERNFIGGTLNVSTLGQLCVDYLRAIP